MSKRERTTIYLPPKTAAKYTRLKEIDNTANLLIALAVVGFVVFLVLMYHILDLDIPSVLPSADSVKGLLGTILSAAETVLFHAKNIAVDIFFRLIGLVTLPFRLLFGMLDWLSESLSPYKPSGKTVMIAVCVVALAASVAAYLAAKKKKAWLAEVIKETGDDADNLLPQYWRYQTYSCVSLFLTACYCVGTVFFLYLAWHNLGEAFDLFLLLTIAAACAFMVRVMWGQFVAGTENANELERRIFIKNHDE